MRPVEWTVMQVPLAGERGSWPVGDLEPDARVIGSEVVYEKSPGLGVEFEYVFFMLGQQVTLRRWPTHDLMCAIKCGQADTETTGEDNSFHGPRL